MCIRDSPDTENAEIHNNVIKDFNMLLIRKKYYLFYAAKLKRNTKNNNPYLLGNIIIHLSLHSEGNDPFDANVCHNYHIYK